MPGHSNARSTARKHVAGVFRRNSSIAEERRVTMAEAANHAITGAQKLRRPNDFFQAAAIFQVMDEKPRD
jgi:hypothetical protein